jgi:hypothetical protein
MRQVFVPLLSVFWTGAAFAQTPNSALPQPPPKSFSFSLVPNYIPPPVNQISVAREPRKTTSPFFGHLTIESFGLSSSPLAPGYAFSAAYFSSLFNLQRLECPGCFLGPRNLAKFTLPPFGASVTAKLRGDRVELFGGFAGIEAWKPDGTFQPQGLRPWTSTDGDAWLTQGQAGIRVAVDSGRHLWLGATGRRLYNFGPGPKQWTTLGGDATFRLGR